MTGILQGLDLNFNLYLLIRFSGARSFNIEFMNLLNIEFFFSSLLFKDGGSRFGKQQQYHFTTC